MARERSGAHEDAQEPCEPLGASLNAPRPKSWLQVIVVFVSWQERLCGNTICWLLGSVSPRRTSLSLIAVPRPVGRGRYPDSEARSSHATLFGAGVHRHRIFPLGVEKWQGTLELFGREQA